MSNHYRRPFAVFVAGMAVALTTMAFDVRSTPWPPEREATCYTLASVSGNYAAAKKHRTNLKPYRETENDDIIYQVGYIMGLLDGKALYTKTPRAEIAAKMYEIHCI